MHAAALAGAARVSLMGRDDARAKATVADYREELAKLASEVEAEEGEGSDVAPEAKVGAIDGHEANAAPKTEVEAEEGTKAPAKSKRVICSIDPRYAQASLGEIAASCDVVGRSYDQGRDLLKDADVIIDATRLGMKENDPAPFDTSLISSRQTVFDVVYAHGVTNLIAAARAAGAAAYDGEGMLVAQAVATVHDIESALVLSVGFDSIDLFEVMAQSAGFKCAQCV